MAIRTGTAGNDTLWGTSWADTLYGLAGNDYLNGQGANDKLYGGAGEDKLDGGSGDDLLDGGDAIDALFGGIGADTLIGGGSGDYLDGGAGNDSLLGGLGDDRLRGGDGSDVLNGNAGTNDLRGGLGDDTLIYEAAGLQTAAASNLFIGDAGVDTLHIAADSVTIAKNGGPVDAYVGIYIGHNGQPGEITFNDGQVAREFSMGQFAGIEKFSVADDTALLYVGGALDATVTGSNADDKLFSGSGDEFFDGRGGSDEFLFLSGYGDVDRIENFDADEDLLIYGFLTNSNGDDIADMTITEAGGETIITASTFGGEVLHTLYIDQVGLPADIFRDWNTYA